MLRSTHILRWARLSCVLASALVLVVALAHLVLAHPLADDFVMACRARDLGSLVYSFRYVYFGLSGRWFGHALIGGMLELLDPTRFYPLLLLVTNGVHALALHTFVRALAGPRAPRRATAGATFVLFALLWAARPGLRENVYWFCGSVAYQVSFSLSVILVAGLVRWRAGEQAARPPIRITAGWCLLALVATGIHELTGLVLCGALLTGALVLRRGGSPRFGAWAVVLAAAVVGVLVVLLAPGNAERAARQAGRGDLGYVVRTFASDLAGLVAPWILDPKLLAVSLLLALHPGFGRDGASPPWGQALARGRWLVLAAWIPLLAGCLAVPRWMLGTWLPGRMEDLSYHVFFFGWLVCVFAWSRPREGRALRPSAGARPALQALACGVLAVAMVGSESSRHGAADLLSGRTLRWHETMRERYAAMREARESASPRVILPPTPQAPRLYAGLMDISIRRFAWRREAFCRFFGVRSIRFADRPRPGRDARPSRPGPETGG